MLSTRYRLSHLSTYAGYLRRAVSVPALLGSLPPSNTNTGVTCVQIGIISYCSSGQLDSSGAYSVVFEQLDSIHAVAHKPTKEWLNCSRTHRHLLVGWDGETELGTDMMCAPVQPIITSYQRVYIEVGAYPTEHLLAIKMDILAFNTRTCQIAAMLLHLKAYRC